MRRKLMYFLVCLLLACTVSLAACTRPDGDIIEPDGPPAPTREVTASKLVTYEGPTLMESSRDVSVSVEGEPQFVYDTRVNHNRIFSWVTPNTTNPVVLFDFEGKVRVEVTVTGAAALYNTVVRPLSYGITPQVMGNKISFTLEYPAPYTVEFGRTESETASDNALHILSNVIEERVDPANVPADTVYVGPGIWEAGAIPLSSGKTLYLAGGAYVFGQVRAEQLENITIKGRGILAASIYPRTKANEYYLPIEMRNCKNVTIDGITMLDPAGWAVTLYKCEDVVMKNVNIITARSNGDGISVQSSKNVKVSGGFVRTWDDSLVVKNVDRGVTENVTFEGVTVWTDLAQSCEVGFEANGETMKDITFRDITVVHAMHKAVISLHNADDAKITNVKYEYITVEEAQTLGDNRLDGEDDYLMDFQILYSAEWSKAPARGPVSGVVVNNIKVLAAADSLVCRISGESSEAKISDVTLNNVQVEGNIAKSESDLKLTSTYATNVKVTTSDKEIKGARTAYPYILKLASDAVEKSKVSTKTQNGLEVPPFAMRDIEETYMGEKLDISGTEIAVTHGKGTNNSAPYDDGTGSYESPDHPAENLIDGNRGTYFQNLKWTNEQDEFIAITFEFTEKVRPGVIRVYLDKNSSYVYGFDMAVFNKKNRTNQNFAVAISKKTYSVSPSSGNYFDLKLSATFESEVLQLRLYRTSGMMAMDDIKLSEVTFFPSSLSTNATPTADSTSDVYGPNNLVDGDNRTYWEGLHEDSWCMVDLGVSRSFKYINLHLPPIMTWEPRTQRIEILISTDGVNFTTLIGPTDYRFDPMTGNYNSIVLDTPATARYVKLQWSENTSIGGYGAQLSEIYIY